MDVDSLKTAPRRKRRGWQFSLGALLIAITVLGVIFARWFWRPFDPSQVECGGGTLIDAKFVLPILERHHAETASEKCVWAILNDQEMAEIESFAAQTQVERNQQFTSTDDPDIKELYCFRMMSGLGLCVTGQEIGTVHAPGRVQIINGQAQLLHERVEEQVAEKQTAIQYHYEGRLPQGTLAFFQRMNDNTFLTTFLSVKP